VNPAGAVYSRFRAGTRVWLPHIAGHRDGDQTDCPGSALYARLPDIRRATRALAPHVARLTLVRAPAAPQSLAQQPGAPQSPAVQQPGVQQPGVQQPAPAPGEGEASLRGTLSLLDGRPVAGAQITLQWRSVSAHGEVVQEHPFAQAVTDAAGVWALDAASAAAAPPGAAIRALYDGGGSPAAAPTVSETLVLRASLRRPA
jgi:hypothetical protein